eukprot:Sdes_comp18073_c0_seq1m7479
MTSSLSTRNRHPYSTYFSISLSRSNPRYEDSVCNYCVDAHQRGICKAPVKIRNRMRTCLNHLVACPILAEEAPDLQKKFQAEKNLLQKDWKEQDKVSQNGHKPFRSFHASSSAKRLREEAEKNSDDSDPLENNLSLPKTFSSFNHSSMDQFGELLLLATLCAQLPFSWIENPFVLDVFRFLAPEIQMPSKQTLFTFSLEQLFQKRNPAPDSSDFWTLNFHAIPLNSRNLILQLCFHPSGKILIHHCFFSPPTCPSLLDSENSPRLWLQAAFETCERENICVAAFVESNYSFCGWQLENEPSTSLHLPCFSTQLDDFMSDFFFRLPEFRGLIQNLLDFMPHLLLPPSSSALISTSNFHVDP